MSNADTLTVLVSLLAVVISTVSLVRTRRVERLTAELAQKQLSNFEEADRAKLMPKLNVILTKLNSTYYFIVSNRGEGSARNLKFELIDCPHSPLLDRADKNPWPELKSNQQLKFIAAIHMGSPQKYEARLSWEDINGKANTETHYLAL